MSASKFSSNAQPSMPVRFQPRLAIFGKVPATSSLPASHGARPVQIAVVGNKVDCPADESFIRSSLPEFEFLGIIPYVAELRTADREGKSVLNAINDQLQRRFHNILEKLGC